MNDVPLDLDEFSRRVDSIPRHDYFHDPDCDALWLLLESIYLDRATIKNGLWGGMAIVNGMHAINRIQSKLSASASTSPGTRDTNNSG